MENINLNKAECIKEIHNFGSTVYTNICNGTHTSVSWGNMEYAGTVFIGLFIIAIAFIFTAIAVDVIKHS